MSTKNIYQETLDSLKSCKSINSHINKLNKICGLSTDATLNSKISDVASQLNNTIKAVKKNHPNIILQRQILSQKHEYTPDTSSSFKELFDYCNNQLI